MNIEDAKKNVCLRDGNIYCQADKCMAWLGSHPDKPEEGQCMWMCLGTAAMKIAHIWAQLATTPRSNIVR